MVENIVDRICANLASLPFFAEAYGVAELVKNQYAVIKNGDGRPVFYQDARNGLVYLRKNGRVDIESSEELSAVGCDEYQTRRYPYRVIAVAKRGQLNNNAISFLTANLSAALDIELKKSERAPLGLTEAYVDILGFIEDREDLISSEKLPEKLSLDLAVVAVDVEIVLGGQQSCFDANTCFVAPAPPVIEARVPQVVFVQNSGVYAGFLNVEMTNELEGATIYYTTNGTFPTPQSGTLYTEAVLITADTSFNAVGYLNGYLPSFVSQISYSIVAVSVFAIPEGGEYVLGTLNPIVLGSNSLTASIYYTTDGSEPTESSTLFAGSISPFQVITTLRFRAFDAPAAPSEIASETYNIKALAPTVTPASGTFENSVPVVFGNPNPLGDVWASLNGGAFQIVTNETFTEITSYVAEVRFSGYVTSEQVSGTINIQCAAATFDPPAGAVTQGDELTIATTTPDATIHFTSDGSTPTTSSPIYDPLDKPTIDSDATYKALVVKSGVLDSTVSEASYVVVDADVAAFVQATQIDDENVIDALQVLVSGLKAGTNIWSKLDAIYPLVGATADQHKYNLKDPRDLDAAYRLQFLGGWTHGTNGAQPNGIDGYARTFYDTINYLSGGYSQGMQLLTSRDFNAGLNFRFYMGVSGVDIDFYIDAANQQQRYGAPSDLVGVLLGTSGNNLGFWAQARNTGFTGQRYLLQDGTILTRANSNPPVVTGGEVIIGKRSDDVGYVNERYGFIFIGDTLTNTELQTLRTLVLNFNTTIR